MKATEWSEGMYSFVHHGSLVFDHVPRASWTSSRPIERITCSHVLCNPVGTIRFRIPTLWTAQG